MQLTLRVAAMDRKFAEARGAMTEHDTLTYLAWSNSLSRDVAPARDAACSEAGRHTGRSHRTAGRRRVNILNALSDEALFAPLFRGSTWAAWRAFLAALFGLPMDS